MIVSGGFNILPREVEDVLSTRRCRHGRRGRASPMTNGARPSPLSSWRAKAPAERGRMMISQGAQRLGACPQARQFVRIADDRRRQVDRKDAKGGLWTGREPDVVRLALARAQQLIEPVAQLICDRFASAADRAARLGSSA